MNNREVSKEEYFNYEERLAKAKQDPNFERVKQWTLKHSKISEVGGGEIYPPGFDIDFETFKNYGKWKQGQLDINEDTES